MSNPNPNTQTAPADLVAMGCSVRDLTRLFKSRRDAARYFAQENAKLHSLKNATGPCVACESTEAPIVTAYQWEAQFFSGIGFGLADVFKLALGHVGLKVKSEILRFMTFHSTCSACARRGKLLRSFANVLNFVGLFLVVIAGMVAALGWSGSFYYDRPDERTAFRLTGLVATAVIVVGVICLRALPRLRVHAAVRHLAKRPFYYHSSKVSAGA
jgi:hypothetical protein